MRPDTRDKLVTFGLLGGATLLLWGGYVLLVSKPKAPAQPPVLPPMPPPPTPPKPTPFADLPIGTVVAISSAGGPLPDPYQIILKAPPGQGFTQAQLEKAGVKSDLAVTFLTILLTPIGAGLKNGWIYVGDRPGVAFGQARVFSESDVNAVRVQVSK